MPGKRSGKGVKRTNTSDTSVLNDSGSKKPSRKKSKKKNKSKSTEDNSCVNTGDSSGDITNVNKPPNTPSNSKVLDTMNTSPSQQTNSGPTLANGRPSQLEKKHSCKESSDKEIDDAAKDWLKP
ncbi:uncharacterized protein LOC134722478 [Mytilus trossulus]|uniref:uncharacterized protein LOC134722478 n=1 Tax=Mytilus trossulus TaxID=6551 RepID=UPI00300507B7